MKSIIFVCLGNICRSPLAEAIAKKIAQERLLDIVIDSAGTGAWHVGENPCANSVKVAKNHGIDISNYVARQVNKNDFKTFDLIVALDHSNVYNLSDMGAKENLVKLGDFGLDGEDIPDPYFFNGFEGFEKVYEMIEIAVKDLFDQKFNIKTNL
jgi:protein-tyrosine phosphatase